MVKVVNMVNVNAESAVRVLGETLGASRFECIILRAGVQNVLGVRRRDVLPLWV